MKSKGLREIKKHKLRFTKSSKETQKENWHAFITNCKFYWVEYCQNTSIHGLKFLGERKRHTFERLT